MHRKDMHAPQGYACTARICMHHTRICMDANTRLRGWGRARVGSVAASFDLGGDDVILQGDPARL